MAEDERTDMIVSGLEAVGARVRDRGDRVVLTLGIHSVPSVGMLSFAASQRWLSALIGLPELSGVIVLPEQDVPLPGVLVAEHENPRDAFYRLHAHLWERTGFYGRAAISPPVVHPSARVHSTAWIGNEADIGPNVVVGAGAVVESKCVIGERCSIGPNAVIGGEGFQTYQDVDGTTKPCPHAGVVVLEADVTVKALACVDRGLWGETRLGRGVQIDNLVHIAHNVAIGENTVIPAGVIIGGGTKIGRNCWIGVGSTLRDGLTIGDGAFIGMGAVVSKDMVDAERRVAVPSLDERQGVRLRRVLEGR